MTPQILLLLSTILGGLVLFSLEVIPTDVTALGILLFLILTGLLPAEKAFAGFGSNAVIMILGILIMVEALIRTGVTDAAGRAILRRTDNSANMILLIVMIAASAMASFISNTAATAFFLPIVIGLARRAKLSPAKFLMPLAFASVLAGSVTLISTSTNIIVSSLLTKYDMPPMGMFELTLVGVPIAVVGIIYMLVFGHRLVPDRIPAEGAERFSVHLYLTEILILPGSSLTGKTLEEAALGRDLDLQVLQVLRDETSDFTPQADTRLEEGDILLVEGEREKILQVKEMVGIDIRVDVELPDPRLEPQDIGLTEVILPPGSPLTWQTLKGLRFREKYELQVLAINRHGQRLNHKMSHIRLRAGDLLVVQGDRTQIASLENRGVFRILSSIEEKHPKRERAPIAITIFVGALAAATFGLVSLPVAALLGALLVFVTRCITSEEAYSRINWRVLILIASMLGLGEAMEATGTAQFLAELVTQFAGHASPLLLLTGFFFLTVLLTQPMGDQAATVVILPVAIRTALQLGLNPRPFAMMTALTAGCSLLTPLEPACLLVYGPGHYRFLDYLKAGTLLAVLTYVIAIVMVPLLWPIGAVP
ncbi:MAG: SLC13 family permease [Anaerolineae bacterium]